MLKSATELVNSGMEVGFVRRGVREVEMLVRKRLDWYSESDYEFVSDLIQRLDGIKGLKKETKMVLWRIHMAMEIQTRKRNKKKKLKVAKGSSKLVFLNPSGKDAAALISTLLQLLESQKKQSANVFYLFCWEYLQNGLAEMIFNVYQCSIDAPENRSKSISLLCALLTHFEENDVNLSRLAIRKIKPLLISSLSLPVPRDSDVEILSKITYLVALDAFTSSNNGWDELCVCIYWMAMDDLRKALYFFRDLPPVYEDFLFAMVERIFPEILTRLNQERGDAKDWSLALQTAFKMAMQLLESSRMDLADNIQYAMVMWASKLVRQEKQQILQQGLEELRWIVEEYTKQYKYDANQHKFALGLASMMARMAGAGMEIKAVAREIYQILKSKKANMENKNALLIAAKKVLATEDLKLMQELISSLFSSPENQQIRPRNELLRRIYRFCSTRFPNCLSLKLLRVYADPRFGEDVRRSSIECLNVLLSVNGKGTEPLLELVTLQELSPLLISCLEGHGIPENAFKTLALVTDRVAREIFVCHDIVWPSLGTFISSRIKPEFKKAVYIFQSLSMPLNEDEFVAPLMKNLLPPILKWLDPLMLNQENNWVLAFLGAFCSAIHMLGTRRVDLVGNIVYEMLTSVTELVKRGMELGFVIRAFREMEMIMSKQSDWYCIDEYKFVSGLIRRMKGIEGMKHRTKAVLWRIQFVMEMTTVRSVKVRDNGVDDWLNQCIQNGNF
ncbi:PREDICTED: uncharacterized protein LOC104805981 [Tarenaya hassleriana]|uniref:uncharacterized protein LOC104805981 n=1 Tax=Tarenaya hassleriana TaxID=28532 RepID=UPI0008FD8017|nr:PREDICTED: uncharacterized protein LOC104805981 [Tarenaya hassleriana]